MNGVNWAQKKDALKMRPNNQTEFYRAFTHSWMCLSA